VSAAPVTLDFSKAQPIDQGAVTLIIDHGADQSKLAAAAREVQMDCARSDVAFSGCKRMGMAQTHGSPQPNPCGHRRSVCRVGRRVHLSEFSETVSAGGLSATSQLLKYRDSDNPDKVESYSLESVASGPGRPSHLPRTFLAKYAKYGNNASLQTPVPSSLPQV
jgi:hypothetical protein